MSNILAVYNALAAKSVTIPSTGEVIAAHGPSNLKNTVNAADVPTRLISPARSIRRGGEGDMINSNHVAAMSWHIADVMLYRPQNAGRGIVDFAAALTDYGGAYAEMMRVLRPEIGRDQNVTLTAWDISPEMVRYPLDSDRLFYGMVCVVHIEEYLTVEYVTSGG